MATAQTFEELGVWQEARELVKQIYAVTGAKTCRRDFGLRDQMTRAATSTMSNIAEGFERASRKEFIQFLNIAKGSNGEVRSQLYVGLDQEYLDSGKFEELRGAAVKLSRRIASLIRDLQKYPDNKRTRRST